MTGAFEPGMEAGRGADGRDPDRESSGLGGFGGLVRRLAGRAALCMAIAIAPAATALGQSSKGILAGNPVSDVAFDQRLGMVVPHELEFRDETGRAVRLGEYFGERPVVLSLAYYRCPMLCGMVFQGIARSLKALTLEPGHEFEVLTVSFDATETPELARQKKENYALQIGSAETAAAWHFLTGDEEAIRRLTESVGFRYAWDERQKQYAHAAGLVILTPQGKVSRYLFGVDYAPRDLRLSLVEAGEGKIGSLTDRLLLLCYQYDPLTGRYSAIAIGSLRVGAVLTLAGLALLVLLLLRRERAQRRSAPEGGG